MDTPISVIENPVSTPLLEIGLLGCPTVSCNGEPIVFRRRKSIALLAYVVMLDRSVSRRELATLLWPDLDTPHSLSALRTVLADLKRHLPDSGIAIRSDAVVAEKPFLSVDVWLVSKAMRRDASIETRRRAAALWRGGFLSGFSVPGCPGFSDWKDRITRVMHHRYVELLGNLVEDHVDEDLPETALKYAFSRVEEDPLDEEACQDLMVLLADGNKRSEALREYEAYADRLQKDLSVPPDDSIAELADLIRHKRYARKRHFSVSRQEPLKRLAIIVRAPSQTGSDEVDRHVIFEEALYCALAGTQVIELISRTSTGRLADYNSSIGAIVERTRADFILTGDVFQEQGRDIPEWVCEMRLIEGDREGVIENFAVHDHSHLELAIRLAEMVTSFLADQGNEEPGRRGCVLPASGVDSDPGAVWRLRGQHLMRMDSGESFDQALIAFQKAVDLNPRDAAAWAGVAAALYTAASNPWWYRPQHEAFPAALEACTTALAVDPSEPTALRVRARLAIDMHWDFQAAERDLSRAVEIAPADSDVLVACAEAMAIQRKLDRAIEFSDRAYRLNPADYFTLAARYWIGLASGRYKQAIEAIDEIEALIPHPFLNHWARGVVYTVAGHPEITIATTQDTLDQLLETPRGPLASTLAVAYAMEGRIDEATTVLARLEELAQYADGFRVPVAWVLRALGRVDASLDLLEEAVTVRDAGINFMALVPAFRPLFGNPRYRQILEKAGIPEW